jgi:Flp pilus assembly secretin CpaC
LWPLFTSASALLALISKQLDVVNKVKRHTAAAAEMGSLAFDSATLIVRMKINAQFPVADFEKKLLAFRSRYRVQIEKSEHDLLLTERLRTHIQSKLDKAKTIAPPRGNHHESR